MTLLQTEDAVAICRRALGLVEAANSFDSLEDLSNEAQEARLRYDIRRRALLEALDWNFARRRANGSRVVVDATPHDLPYAYAIPANTLRIRNVHVGRINAQWSREEYVYADMESAQMVYTVDVQNPVVFAPIFTSALEYLLAVDFAMIFSRSVNRSEVARTNFRRIMDDADQMEGLERSNGEAYASGGWVDVIEGSSLIGGVSW